jgi:hypothetical protein
MTRHALQLIHRAYRAAAQRMERGQVLPYANFFKSRIYLAEILENPLPKGLSQAAQQVVGR